MKRFWRNCNKLQLLLFVFMAYQTVVSVQAHQWAWAAIGVAFCLANLWWALPAFTQVRLQLFFQKKGK